VNLFLAFAVAVAILTTVVMLAATVAAIRHRNHAAAIPLCAIAWALFALAVAIAARAPVLYRPFLRVSWPAIGASGTTDTIVTDTVATDTVAINYEALRASDQAVDESNYSSLIQIKNGRVQRKEFESLSGARQTLLVMRLRKAAEHGDAVAQRALREIEAWTGTKPMP
jgi:hypothetical protein